MIFLPKIFSNRTKRKKERRREKDGREKEERKANKFEEETKYLRFEDAPVNLQGWKNLTKLVNQIPLAPLLGPVCRLKSPVLLHTPRPVTPPPPPPAHAHPHTRFLNKYKHKLYQRTPSKTQIHPELINSGVNQSDQVP